MQIRTFLRYAQNMGKNSQQTGIKKEIVKMELLMQESILLLYYCCHH